MKVATAVIVPKKIIEYNTFETNVFLGVSKNGVGITLPGGKINNGETLKEAAVRECKEETGITPTKLRELWTGPSANYDYLVVFFLADEYHFGELQSSIEGEAGWFHEEDFLESSYKSTYEILFRKFDEQQWLKSKGLYYSP